MAKSLFNIGGYSAVIPKIQNVYPVEKDRFTGWCFGFKYVHGTFEFFTFKTKPEAKMWHDKLAEAIEDYYSNNIRM